MLLPLWCGAGFSSGANSISFIETHRAVGTRKVYARWISTTAPSPPSTYWGLSTASLSLVMNSITVPLWTMVDFWAWILSSTHNHIPVEFRWQNTSGIVIHHHHSLSIIIILVTTTRPENMYEPASKAVVWWLHLETMCGIFRWRQPVAPRRTSCEFQ